MIIIVMSGRVSVLLHLGFLSAPQALASLESVEVERRTLFPAQLLESKCLHLLEFEQELAIDNFYC